MTRDQLVTLIKQRCNRDTDTALDTKIVTEMQFVQANLLEGMPTLPWFLLSENLNTSTTVGEERVPVPINVGSVTGKDFLLEYEDGALWYYDDTAAEWVELIKEDYDALVKRYGETQGKPIYYALDGEYFVLRPIPDAVLQVRIKCYLRAAVLSTNVENVWLRYASDLMLGETGKVIAGEYIRDMELVARFEAIAREARGRIFMLNEARKHTNRNYSMGGDDN